MDPKLSITTGDIAASDFRRVDGRVVSIEFTALRWTTIEQLSDQSPF